MAIHIHFTKMSGAGNDFVVINNIPRTLETDYGALARAICSRHFGVGADGLLILEPSLVADFHMRYYNADGSYGGMCGNGGRCAARFAFLEGMTERNLRFEALGHIYTAEVLNADVKLWMKDPKYLKSDMLISTSSSDFKGDFVDTGSPHFVGIVDNVETMDVASIGRAIRFDRQFAPEGCNANFVKLDGERAVLLRTFERGVEGETLACGTGSVAAAVVAAHRYSIASPVHVRVRSGESLRVYFERSGTAFSQVILEGSAHVLFRGSLLYDADEMKLVDLHEGM